MSAKFIKFIKISALIFSLSIIQDNELLARDYIKIVGSSTVYPFATIIAEDFSHDGKFKTPIVESTGTGGGIKLFCGGIGENHPDFVNASRKITEAEIKKCNENGIKSIAEIKIGYDGIIIADSKTAQNFDLTKEQLFLAVADQIPSDGKLIKNNYTKWNEINKSFPNQEIAIYGPPTTSGTRDAFAELIMEEVCVNIPEFISAYPDKDARKKICHIIRTDGKYIEAGENDNLIVAKLKTNSKAFGIFGYSFLAENKNAIKALKINNVEPNFENILSGKYGASRPLFIYMKQEHIDLVPGMREFAQKIISADMIGNKGVLVQNGLIPMNEKELKQNAKKINDLQK